jgi:hypothetical protein
LSNAEAGPPASAGRKSDVPNELRPGGRNALSDALANPRAEVSMPWPKASEVPQTAIPIPNLFDFISEGEGARAEVAREGKRRLALFFTPGLKGTSAPRVLR